MHVDYVFVTFMNVKRKQSNVAMACEVHILNRIESQLFIRIEKFDFDLDYI